MSNSSNIAPNAIQFAAINSSENFNSTSLGLIAPEPSNRLANSFSSILKSTASNLLQSGGEVLGLNSDYAGLLQMQIQAQQELQTISMLSNLEKSKHETQMAAIRNIRVG